MPKAGIEPATRGFSVLCSTNWAIWAYVWIVPRNAGSRPSVFLLHTKLRGQDLNLRPSGYEPDELPDCSTPRQLTYYSIIYNKYWNINTYFQWAEVDSNHRSKLQQIYSLSPLATRESTHNQYFAFKEPMIGLEPITCWLQISCSANWATSAYHT